MITGKGVGVAGVGSIAMYMDQLPPKKYNLYRERHIPQPITTPVYAVGAGAFWQQKRRYSIYHSHCQRFMNFMDHLYSTDRPRINYPLKYMQKSTSDALGIHQ